MVQKPDTRFGPTIVVTGDLTNGYRFIGPFEVPSGAVEWAVDNCSETWVLGTLDKPETYNDEN